MKNRIFYNLKNEKFNSFFLEGHHNNYIFSKYIEKENGEIESEINNDFIEIKREEYEKLCSAEGEIIYENGELRNYIYPICIENYIKQVFDWSTKKWEEGATLEEQEIYYRNKIIDKTKKIKEIEESGFGASNLKIELESLKLKHQEVTHLLGLEIDKTIV